MSKTQTEWKWTPLPPEVDLETPKILKKALEAQQYVSELKGISYTIPNQAIILNTLSIQEARDSSEIENIVTTSDALYKASIDADSKIDQTTKEVERCAVALRKGFELIQNQGVLTIRHIKAIQEKLEDNNAGVRKLPGTALTNPATGEIVFMPPQDEEVIQKALSNLEAFINDDSLSPLHPLIKMAIIHVQFESIHPFYDGNGRTGRILNILYLTHKGLLDVPVLYLSRFIVKNKAEYYRLLQRVRSHNDWESWILYMLEGVLSTSKNTIKVIKGIKELMLEYKHIIRREFSFYSQDLINHLFKHPYTKISYLMNELDVSRPTATKYLDELTEMNLLNKIRVGRENYYINTKLMELLSS